MCVCVCVCVCKEEMCGANILACSERAFVISVGVCFDTFKWIGVPY